MEKVIDWWWEDNDFHIQTENGIIVCKNAYPTDIHYEGLDYSSTETVEITKKYE